MSQTGAQCSRWGGGPPLAVRAVRGTGAVGRSPGVRPVVDPVLTRRSVGPMREKSKSGPDVEGGGDPVLVLMWAAVPKVGLVEEAVDDALDMILREARKAARGVKTRGGGHTNGERRMVSYMHGRTRGGCRVTVVMYRNLLSWRKGLHL